MKYINGKQEAAAGSSLGDTAEVRELEIPAVISGLKFQTDLLNEIVGHLESRLKGVCRTDPADEGDDVGRSISTEMGESIYAQAERVRLSNDRLSRILRLLEL